MDGWSAGRHDGQAKTYRELFAATCLNVGSFAVASLALGTITYAATGSPILTALSIFGAPLLRLVGQALFGSGSDLVRPRLTLVLTASITLVADLVQAVPGLPGVGGSCCSGCRR